jgi:hypothetical protein
MPFEAGSPPSAVPQSPVPPSSLSREFTVGNVVSKTFSVWWSHVAFFSLLTLAAQVPIIATSLVGGVPVPGMTAPSRNPFQPGAATALDFPGYLWLAYLATMLLFLVQAGSITHAVISHLGGKRVSIEGMVATGLRRFFPMLGVGVVAYLMFAFGLVLLIVPGVILACALSVVMPVTVAERRGTFGGIGRSFFLTKGHRFSIFVAILIVVLAVTSVNLFSTFMLPTYTASFSPMLGTLLGLGLNVVFGSLAWIAPSVIYHDLRVAKEGLDTQQLSSVFD